MAYELGDVVVRGSLHDVLCRAGLHDASPFEDRDPVAELECLIEIVADEQNGLLHALLQGQQLVLELTADQGVERRERLVHQQNVRVGRKGARQADSLLHAARELAAVAIAPLGETYELELLVDDPAARLGRIAPQLEAEADVVSDRSPRQQPELLKHHGNAQAADAPQRCRIARGSDVDDGIAVPHQHLPARDEVQAVGCAQQRRLPRSRQAHENRNLPALDAQRGVRYAHHHAGFLDDLGACAAGIERRERLLDGRGAGATPRLGAEENVDGTELERGAHEPPALSDGRLIRSRMIASSTMTKPASNPMPTCTVFRARTTGTPRPPAPTSAAITTIERLSMMH